MFLIAKSSIAITLLVLTNSVVNLCKKSVRVSLILACIRATLSRAPFRLLEHDCFPTQFLLRACKFLIQPIEMLGIGYALTITGSNQTGYTSVNANLFFS